MLLRQHARTGFDEGIGISQSLHGRIEVWRLTRRSPFPGVTLGTFLAAYLLQKNGILSKLYGQEPNKLAIGSETNGYGIRINGPFQIALAGKHAASDKDNEPHDHHDGMILQLLDKVRKPISGNHIPISGVLRLTRVLNALWESIYSHLAHRQYAYGPKSAVWLAK